MPVVKKKISLYQSHVNKWSNCTRCELSEGRRKVVLVRGQLPCDILFIGEAPGESEDVIGTPFVGPAGKLLDHIIKHSIDGHTIRYALTNLVGCFPKEQKATKNHAPPEECIKACSPRLDEVYRMARPDVVVRVGALAVKWVDKLFDWQPNHTVDLVHPAFILRQDVVSQQSEIDRSIAKLKAAIEQILPF